MASTPPFSRFEFMIAWRYLRAKRAEGGVSVMTWISLIGITLAVFALIVTLAVRSGFRSELVSTFLGSNAHVTVYSSGYLDAEGQMVKGFTDYDAIAAKLAAVSGVTEAASGKTLRRFSLRCNVTAQKHSAISRRGEPFHGARAFLAPRGSWWQSGAHPTV